MPPPSLQRTEVSAILWILWSVHGNAIVDQVVEWGFQDLRFVCAILNTLLLSVLAPNALVKNIDMYFVTTLEGGERMATEWTPEYRLGKTTLPKGLIMHARLTKSPSMLVYRPNLALHQS